MNAVIRRGRARERVVRWQSSLVGALAVFGVALAAWGGSAVETSGLHAGSTSRATTSTATSTPAYTVPVDHRVATVASIRRGANDKQLIVTIGRLPAPGTPPRCHVSVDLHAYEMAREITLSIAPRIDDSGFDPHTCDLSATTDFTERLTQPLAHRPVTFNVIGVVERYVANGAGVYGECRLPSCDPATPIAEPATCANLRSFAFAADAPKNFDMVDVRCDGHWAVYGLDYSSGSCPPDDGTRRSCAGTNVRRIYWKADGDSWKIVASDNDARCGAVPATVPDFPTVLCADLPAIR